MAAIRNKAPIATIDEVNIIRPSEKLKNRLITFNLRGTRFLLEDSVLDALPEKSGFATKLRLQYGFGVDDLKSRRVQIEELYLDRNPVLFHYIVDFLESDTLHFPHNVCSEIIHSEMLFWGFSENALSRCCWQRLAKEYTANVEQIQVARRWRWLEAKRKRIADELPSGTTYFRTPIREKVRLFFEDGGSSIFAKIWGIFLTLVIISSLGTLILETEFSFRSPPYEDVIQKTNITKGNGLYEFYTVNSYAALWVSYMDLFCLCVLSFEYCIRFIVSYRKCLFLLHPLNITDLLGILPMWCLFAVNQYRESGQLFSDTIEKIITFLAILRLFRIFRFVRLMTYSKQLKIIYLAIMMSYRQIVILACLMALLSITFGSAIYYAEMKVDNFASILTGQWWAIVTMTTVGYGDYFPKTEVGYVIGVLCSLTGIVHIAMATTVIVNNFIVTTEGVERFLRNQQRHTDTGEKAIKLWNEDELDEEDDTLASGDFKKSQSDASNASHSKNKSHKSPTKSPSVTNQITA